MTEEELLEHLALVFIPHAREVICGIGDDCAVIETADRWHLFTIDTMVEGVHFSFSYFTPHEVGRKLAAVNLSDIAAMGGRPRFALLSLCIPHLKEDSVNQFLEGVKSKLEAFGAELIGGDLSRTENKWHLSLTLIGETAKGGAVFRSGAQEGDLIYVSRPLGGAAAALELWQKGIEPPAPLKKAHLDPEPEIKLGEVLARHQLASAMIDISDGLLLDLFRLCKASKKGALIFPEKVPVITGLSKLPLSRPPLEYALSGGEDFALLFTIPSGRIRALKNFWPHNLYEIGKIIPQEGLFFMENSEPKPVSPNGFDHFIS